MSHLYEILRRYFAVIAALMMAVVPLHAKAITLSVDFDPGMAGIQPTLAVMPGDNFVVDIVIADVVNLQTYKFDLDFDSSVLSAAGVVSGGFLSFPTLVFPNSIGASEVNFGEVGLVPIGATGGGILASITFNAHSAGISTLDLDTIVLSAPFGAPITDQLVLGDGTVTVSAGGGPTPVSAPASGALFSFGLLGLLLRRRAMKSKATG